MINHLLISEHRDNNRISLVCKIIMAWVCIDGRVNIVMLDVLGIVRDIVIRVVNRSISWSHIETVIVNRSIS